jgi:hypothetical protein
MTEQIENQRESILEGQYIPAGSSERIFGTLSGLTDYMRIFCVENGRFLTGNMDGRKVYVLVYQPVNQ